MSDTFLLCLQLKSQEVFTVLFTHLILTNNLGENYDCIVLLILLLLSLIVIMYHMKNDCLFIQLAGLEHYI